MDAGIAWALYIGGMGKLRVHNFAISLDGYAAGPNQSPDKPFGDMNVVAPGLHDWMFATRMGQQMLGNSGGEEGIDNDFALAGDAGIGATIMGRNMFGRARRRLARAAQAQ